MSLTQESVSFPEVEWAMDLRIIPLPEGSLQADNQGYHGTLENIKDNGINVAMLLLQTLHALHQGVSYEL